MKVVSRYLVDIKWNALWVSTQTFKYMSWSGYCTWELKILSEVKSLTKSQPSVTAGPTKQALQKEWGRPLGSEFLAVSFRAASSSYPDVHKSKLPSLRASWPFWLGQGLPVVLPEAAIPSEMLSVTDFLSEPFPGDIRLFSCPQRQIDLLLVCALPLASGHSLFLWRHPSRKNPWPFWGTECRIFTSVAPVGHGNGK